MRNVTREMNKIILNKKINLYHSRYKNLLVSFDIRLFDASRMIKIIFLVEQKIKKNKQIPRSFTACSMRTDTALIAACGIAASPLIWNIVVQNEYKKHTMERTLGGKYRACYAMAAWIFFSSLYRDYLFQRAIDTNRSLNLTSDSKIAEILKMVGTASIAGGMTLVMSAYYRLGITGTYLGDYFGILMKERVTAFPFSHFENPMYLGSTLSFLGIALRENNSVGVALAAWVYAVYHVSTTYFEGPYTTKIYKEAAEKKAAAEAAAKTE